MSDSSEDVSKPSEMGETPSPPPKYEYSYREEKDAWVPSESRKPLLLDAHTKVWIKAHRTLISAGCASACSTLLAYPLDTMKSRLQAFPSNGLVDCAMTMYKKEGIRSFWRGTATPLISISIVRTASMGVYQKTKYIIDRQINYATGVSPLAHANAQSTLPSLATLACFGSAGAIAGACASVVACPFEITKFNSQVAAEAAKAAAKHSSFEAPLGSNVKTTPRAPALGFFGTVNWIFKTHGVLGFYSGYRLHMLRDTIGSSVWFVTYESSKQFLANGRGKSPTDPIPVFFAGLFCGIASFATVYPIDSAKSIYQRNILFGKSSSETKVEKPAIQFFNRRMYRGLGISMVRSSLGNAVFFSIFEEVKKRINQLETEPDE